MIGGNVKGNEFLKFKLIQTHQRTIFKALPGPPPPYFLPIYTISLAYDVFKTPRRQSAGQGKDLD